MLWAILAPVTVLLSIWLQWIYKNHRILGMARQIPGPRALPFVGNALLFVVQPQEFIKVIRDLMKEYGEVFKVWLGTELNIIVSNPQDVKLLLTNNKTSVKGPQYKYIADVIGGGILSGSGSAWRKHRKIASPNYGKLAVGNYMDIYNREIDFLLQKYTDTPNGQEIDINKYIVQTTSYTVCQTLMGLSRKETLELPHLQYLIDKTPRLYEIMFNRMTNLHLHLDLVFYLTKYYRQQNEFIKYMLEFCKAVVKHRMETLKHKDQDSIINMKELTEEDSINNTQLSVIDRFILSQELDPSELLLETFTVFTTSQEATAKITSAVLLMMAFHPKCQEKLYREIVSVIGKNNVPVKDEDIKQMPYLDMVFKEVIRLFPIAGMMQRTITGDIAISKCTLPEGASLIIPVYHMHRDPKYWHNPDAFDPERFSPENMKTRNPYIYIPFSLGSMDCLGRHFAEKLVKTIVIRFMQNFKLTTSKKFEDLRFVISISTTTMDGFPAALTRRL